MKIADLPLEERLAPGHRLCAGCGAGIVVRLTLKAIDEPVIAVSPTGCVEVSTSIYPYTSWRVPWAHIAFENAAAVASGIEAAIKAFRRKYGKGKGHVVVFAGDGGTYDIGIQALSGALERGHDLLYVCYDNEAYMNTGIQRSGATPRGAWTTTTPVGRVLPGKAERKKNLTEIVASHGVEFVATASLAYWSDLIRKVRRAIEVKGPSFIHAIAPCPRGWRYPVNLTVDMARLAVETRYFPLYEVDNGECRLSVRPKLRPIEEYLKLQGRFEHVFRPENRALLEEIKCDVERNWERLLKLCGG